MKSHTRIGVAALAALAMFTAACGDDDKSSSNGDTATTAASGEVAKNDAAIALLPEAIASKGKLLVATDATYPPSEYIAEDGSTIIGFDVDLMVALGQALGLEVEFQNASFDTIIPGLDSGQFDVGASSFTDNKEREQTVDFVTYFLAGQNFYVAEKFTGRPGSYVPADETIEAFTRICDGVYDDVPEQAFSGIGGIDDLEKKWHDMQKEYGA